MNTLCLDLGSSSECVMEQWTLSEVLLMVCHKFQVDFFDNFFFVFANTMLRNSTCAKTGSCVRQPPFVSICQWKMESEEGMCVIFQTEITRTITNK